MLRYFRLYAHFVRFSLSKAMEFRIDFFFRIVMDCVYYAVNIGFFKVLFLHTNTLGGWSEKDAMVFVSTYLLVDAVQMTLFSANMWMLPSFVNKGDLDYYLIRPASSLFILTLRDFSFNSFVNVIFAIGILIWSLVGFERAIPLSSFLTYTGGVLCGISLYYCVCLLFILPVFWTQSPRGSSGLFFPMLRFMERPDPIFKGWTRRFLTSVLPLFLIASYPARLIIDGPSTEIVVHLIVVTAAFWGILLGVWRIALKRYASASS